MERKTGIKTVLMMAVLLTSMAFMADTSILRGIGRSSEAVQAEADPTTPLGFDVNVEPEVPTVLEEVNVTVTLLGAPSISYGFGFGPLNQINYEFSVDINVSIPWVVSDIVRGNVSHTYELGELSGGSYNFNATVHYRQGLPNGTWSGPSDYSYYKSFEVSPLPMSTDWWPMFHHDLAHSGYSTSTAPTTNKILWTYTTGGNVDSSPAVADGVVYVGSYDGNVYALNALTGALVWKYPTGSQVGASPAVAGGVVYVSSGAYLYALNATTGALVWKLLITPTSLTVVNGIVYVGSGDGNLYALNATTGALMCKTAYPTGGAVGMISPAVSGGLVYVGDHDYSVYAVNATTGAYVWSFGTGGPVPSSPAVADGVVYVGSDDFFVYALNATTGALIWADRTGWSVPCSPAVVEGVVYVGSHDYNVYALDAATGNEIWGFTTGAAVWSSPAVAGGIVFVGSEDNNFYALSATTGLPIWKYATGGWVMSSPAVANGVVYVGSDDGKVYAFGPAASAHDVAVANVESLDVPWDNSGLQKTVVGQGYSLTVKVTASDPGSFTENFNVTVYANTTYVASQNVTLSSGSSTTLAFTWNTSGFAYGNYNLDAYAWPVPGENNTANNSCMGGNVIVTVPGDVNGDGRVDLKDIVLVAQAYGSMPGDPNWNPNADITGSGTVDLPDLVILAVHYAQVYP
jgi:outer membrane protein assembly factor BamB